MHGVVRRSLTVLSCLLTSDELKAAMNQGQIDQGVQRFTATFLDCVVEASGSLLSTGSVELRREALKRVLVYASSALDIATGPSPEVNVVDMVAFVRLSRSVIERHWLPQVFGESARPLLHVFMESEDRAWNLVGRLLRHEQRRELAVLIDGWELANLEQNRVERVRLEELAKGAGAVTDEQQRRAATLLETVKSAATPVDHAALVAERGVFLAKRLPALMRLQARLGVQEVLGDSAEQLRELEEGIARATDGGRAVHELSRLTRASLATAQEARRTIEELRPLLAALPPHEELTQTLASTNHLAEKGLILLREVCTLSPGDTRKKVAIVEAGTDRLMRRAVAYLAFVGAAWAVVFWGGYYGVRRLVRRDRAFSA